VDEKMQHGDSLGSGNSSITRILNPWNSKSPGDSSPPPCSYKPVEFDGFRKLAGLNSFVLTARQWIEKSKSSIELFSSSKSASFVKTSTKRREA
jgi:hypothetical protein